MSDTNLRWITNFYFYKPQPLRTLEEIRADIEVLEKEAERLLGQILVETGTLS